MQICEEKMSKHFAFLNFNVENEIFIADTVLIATGSKTSYYL